MLDPLELARCELAWPGGQVPPVVVEAVRHADRALRISCPALRPVSAGLTYRAYDYWRLPVAVHAVPGRYGELSALVVEYRSGPGTTRVLFGVPGAGPELAALERAALASRTSDGRQLLFGWAWEAGAPWATTGN